MNGHHLYVHTPQQPPQQGTWLLTVPNGTLALWLPLAQELLRPQLQKTMLITTIDQPPIDAVKSAL